MLSMKKLVLAMVLLALVSAASAASARAAQELCEYGNAKTEISSPYYEAGKKIEYAGESFVMLSDPKAIKKLEQLKGLTCLEYGEFYNQGISGSLENLKGLVNLKVLSLHTNPDIYGNICALSEAVKLKSLKLAFDYKVYGDISCLKELNPETLAMTYANISGDLSDLGNMTNLKALYLGGTNVSGDISSLSGLTNLEELTLADFEMNGSAFYGDLASLDNLKKLKKVAVYKTKAVNCEHFHKMHPGIEGGCSDESHTTIKNPNEESERKIGKGQLDNTLDKSKEDKPPEECIINEEFIGEEKCRALVDKTYSGKSASDNPPEECITSGKFIGEDECRKIAGERAVAYERAAAKGNLLQKAISWVISFFRRQ